MSGHPEALTVLRLKPETSAIHACELCHPSGLLQVGLSVLLRL